MKVNAFWILDHVGRSKTAHQAWRESERIGEHIVELHLALGQHLHQRHQRKPVCAEEFGDSDIILAIDYYRRDFAAQPQPLLRRAAGVTGFLCRTRDAGDLAEKMRRMFSLSPKERTAMGLAGREKMVREFDENIVIGRYLETIREILEK